MDNRHRPEPMDCTARSPPRVLTEEQKEALIQKATRALTARPEVGFAYLYGSFLEARPCRDIDIGIFCLEQYAAANTLLLAAEIADAVEQEVRMPVDIRIVNHAPDTFLFSVIRGRRLLHDRIPERREQLVEDVIRRYLDIQPILAHAAREAFVR